MFGKIKSFTISLIAGANVVAVVVMILVGFADHVNPVNYATFSSLGMLFPFAALVNLAFLFFWLVVKWRMAWIPFVGFLLVYVPMRIYVPLNLPLSPPEDAIKVVSFNVGGYCSALQEGDSFGQINEYLRESQADIVCLQEDNDSWRKSEVIYDGLFAYNDIVPLNNSGMINRVGIHTRYPILRKERIEYPSMANGSVAWYLKVGNDTLIVINNHLESTHLSKEDRSQYRQLIKGDMESDTARASSRHLLSVFSESSAKRAPQAEAVHRYVEAHRGQKILVCGDFNDHPLSYTRHIIADGLKDCFVSTGNGLGVSFNRYGMYFRIDHMMCSDNITPYRCQIDSKCDASDHYPVVCWIKIDRKP